MLIAIEGIDGSGKGTQAALLQNAVVKAGYRSTLMGFPQYSKNFFGARIGDFLNGQFGRLDEVHPFLAATLYAGDRLESRSVLKGAMETTDVVILDRYVPSNIAHQAGKRTGAERQQLREWIEHLEYSLYQLPKPDLVVLFDLPASVAQSLIARKKPRDYTQQAADMQEADAGYLEQVREAYLELASARDWVTIPVMDGARIRPIEEVAGDVSHRVFDRLRAKPPAVIREFVNEEP